MLHSDLKSRAKPLKSVQDLASPCYASHEANCFKENIDINKSGTPKLKVEPLQMKRKKKDGGCNLRKSLAWDRAFFTEEGVLDPLELSIISGASCGEGLTGINKDTPGSSKRNVKSVDCQGHKDKAIKELSDEELGKERRKHCLSPKLDSSSSNIMTLDKIKARFGGKSDSVCGGCPRPLSLSSLKRPSNVNSSKSAVKEIKLQNAPCTNTCPTPVRASKSNTPGPICLNPSQIAEPDFRIQTNGVLRSSSKSLKTTQTASKAASLQAVRHSDRNLCVSSLKGHPSVNMSRLPVGKSDEDSDSKIIAANTTPLRSVRPSEDPDINRTPAASIGQHAYDNGLNVQPSQNQTMKHSGLRMPSPSFSYFSQPKASVLHDLSQRGKDYGICGSVKPGSLRLQDTLRTKPEKDNNIPYSSTSSRSSIVISSRSGYLVPPHVNDASCEMVKSNVERDSTQMVEMKVSYDALNSNRVVHRPIEDHAFDRQIQDYSNKHEPERIYPQEAEVRKFDNEIPSEDVKYERLVDESCDRGWRKPELISEHNYGICELERESAMNEPYKETSMSTFGVVNHDPSVGTNCGNVIDCRGQNLLVVHEKICHENYHELLETKSDQLIFSAVSSDYTTSGDTTVLKTMEIARDLLSGSHSSGTHYFGSKDSYAESKHQHGSPSYKAVCGGTVTENFLGSEAYMQNVEHASTNEGCGNYLISDAGDDTIPLLTRSEVQTVCHEVDQEAQRNDGTNRSVRLSVVGIDERWQNENDLRSHESKAVLSHNLANGRYLDNLYQGIQEAEIDDCSLSPITRMCEVPPKQFLNNVTDMIPSISKEHGANQSEPLELINAGFIAENLHRNDGLHLENLSHSNDGLNLDNLFLRKNTTSDGSCEDHILGRRVDFLGIDEGTLMNSSIYAHESLLGHENCTAADGSGDQSSDVNMGPDASRIKPLLNPIKTEVCEDASDFVNEPQPKLNSVQSESALVSNNNQNDFNAKNRTLVIPQDAVPFSDEWLAAIEAAGEDILTKKGGAVQNSPTEKSLPDPSPWSPVKRKNNQIGPFDCTKFTNILPPDSN